MDFFPNEISSEKKKNAKKKRDINFCLTEQDTL